MVVSESSEERIVLAEESGGAGGLIFSAMGTLGCGLPAPLMAYVAAQSFLTALFGKSEFDWLMLGSFVMMMGFAVAWFAYLRSNPPHLSYREQTHHRTRTTDHETGRGQKG